MATIEVKGYVNKPSTFGDGKYARFTLAEKQLHGKEKTPVKVFYDVTDWKSASPPKESSFATIKGYLTVEKVEKEGKMYTNLRINAQSIDIAEPRTNDAGIKETAEKPADDFSDLNF